MKDMAQGKRVFSRWCASVLALLCLAPMVLQCAFAQEQPRVLEIPFPQVPGFSMTDEQGNRYGLVVDYLNEIAQYTGWTYRYIDTTGEAMPQEFLQGKYDLMGGTYYSKVLEAYFGYPQYSCGNTKAVLLTRWENPEICDYNLQDLDGKVIGVAARGKENILRLKEFLAVNGLNCTIREYTSQEIEAGRISEDLRLGVIDLKLGSAAENTGEFRTVSVFDAQPHYIVTHAGDKELLEQLNWALERILSSNPNFAKDTYNRYFSDLNVQQLVLSQEEKEYIRQKGTVTVVVPHYFHPFYCVNSEDGKHDGIIPELLERITEMYGLKFSYLYVDNYVQTQQYVKEGKADMSGFFYSSTRGTAQDGLAQTAPYATISDLVVRNKSVTYPADGLSCGLLEGRQIPQNVTASQVKYYATVYEIVEAVNSGEVDFACGLSPRMEQILQNGVFNNVVPVTLSESRTTICFAMPMPANPQLLTIINKGINSLSEGEKQAILDHNLIAIGKSTAPIRHFIETNPMLAVLILSLFLASITAVIVIIANMRVKAANMQKEVAKAEAESKAKSEFLSRMSHEIRTPMNAIVGTAALLSMRKDVPETVQDVLSKLETSSQYLLALINDILDMSRIDNGMLEIEQENFSLAQLLDELGSMMQAMAQRRQISLVLQTNLQHTCLVGDPIRLKQVLMNLLSNAIKFTPAGGRVELIAQESAAGAEKAVYSFKVTDTGVGIREEDLERIFLSFEQVGSTALRGQGTGLGLPISQNIVQRMGGELRVHSAPGQGSEFYFAITLPFGEEMERPLSPAANNLFARTRLLLAEDNPINAEIATELLHLQGAQVEHAADGAQAVERFVHSPPGYYDLILMDIQMPNMDGLEAARAIRGANHPDAAEIPIIALTANSFHEDREMAKMAGMSDFLAKPLDVNHIYAVLQKWLSRPGG